MSATNHTLNYELSQFLGTDKPAWLVDYNGDMAKIDAGMKANADNISSATSQAGSASDKADQALDSVSTLNTQINGASGIASDLSTLQGTMNTVTSLIGNGVPTTEDKTLIGAINELNSDIEGLDASDITYDNTTSGLTASNVQSAIDELARGTGAGATVKTVTLTAGQTSITLSDESILATSYIDVYTADGTEYTSVTQNVGSVVLGFDAQASDLAVAIVIRNFE